MAGVDTGVEFASYSTSSVVIEQFGGRAGDTSFDNTNALLAAIQAHSTTSEVVIRIPAKTYRFTTPDILGQLTAAAFAANKRIVIEGASPEPQIQGVPEWGLKLGSVFELDFGAWDSFWLEREGAYSAELAFGPIIIRNIAIGIPEDGKGSIGRFVDDGSGAGAAEPAFRGLWLENCAFFNENRNNTWLTYVAGAGYLIDKANQSVGFEIDHGYDVTIRNCSFRGFRWPLKAWGDCPNISGNKYFACGHGPLHVSYPQASVVGASGPQEYVEIPFFAGLVTDSTRTLLLSSETGYKSIFDPDPGAYDCDESSLTWSIAGDDDRLELADMPSVSGTQYDATDFLEPWTLVELTPTTSNQPARRLLIGAVDANGADIIYAGLASGSALPCNCHVDVAGADDGLSRLFGVNAIYIGDRSGTILPRHGRNEAIGVPVIAVLPYKRPVQIIGEVGENYTTDESLAIIRLHAGGSGFLRGCVQQIGGDQLVEHPAIRALHQIAPFANNSNYVPPTANVLGPDGERYRWLIGPSFGGFYSDNAASSLLLDRLASANDEELRPGEAAPYAWRLADLVVSPATSGFVTLNLPTYASQTIYVRVWSPGVKTAGLLIYDRAAGGGTTHTADLVSGWQTVSFTLDAGADAAKLYSNAGDNTDNGCYVWFAGVRPQLPTSDPAIVGALWNNSGIVTVSAG